MPLSTAFRVMSMENKLKGLEINGHELDIKIQGSKALQMTQDVEQKLQELDNQQKLGGLDE